MMYWLWLIASAVVVSAPIYWGARYKRPPYSRKLALAASSPIGVFIFLWGGAALILSS